MRNLEAIRYLFIFDITSMSSDVLMSYYKRGKIEYYLALLKYALKRALAPFTSHSVNVRENFHYSGEGGRSVGHFF